MEKIMKNMGYILSILLVWSGVGSCTAAYPDNDPLTYGQMYVETFLSTDKVCYAPGESVKFSLNKMVPDGNAFIRYRFLNEVLEEYPLTATQWTWTAPSDYDGKGYLVEIIVKESDGSESVRGSVAVDVSSDPAFFPRNGFLSYYGKISKNEMQELFVQLNRYHLNYIQLQDWHYKHHWPLGGTASAPLASYTDICNRTVYLQTLKDQIACAHGYGMKTLFYNLAYGALIDYKEDGVKEEWFLYKDKQHQTKDNHPLGIPFKSSIYVVHPGNTDWQNYLVKRNDDVYKTLDFDGYQIDQLGDRGTVYNYSGSSVDIRNSFKGFIEKMKAAHPEKRLVMNAVSQFGGDKIAQAPVDFLYLEEWDYQFDNLIRDVYKNYQYNANKKNVVCAYMHKTDHSLSKFFNTPAVMLCDCFIHAMGGAHLELGEHMLDSEYFPNNDLRMTPELRLNMIKFYDFITAYENLLRTPSGWRDPSVSTTSATESFHACKPSTSCSAAQKGKITVLNKTVTLAAAENKTMDIVHLINLNKAVHTNWMDPDFTQTEPREVKDLPMTVAVSGIPRKVWAASPDYDWSSPQELSFTSSDGKISFTLPRLKYWSMIVIEF